MCCVSRKSIRPAPIRIGTTGLTALQSLCGASPGSHVFINGGSGGTGIYGIHVAKLIHQAAKVTVTCSEGNIDLVRTMGTDETIDYRQRNVVEALAESADRAGRKFDLVINNIGNDADLYWSSHRYLAKYGNFIQVGMPNINLASFANVLCKRFWPTVLGGGRRCFEMVTVKTDSERLREAADFVSQGKLQMYIEEVYSLEHVGEAFKHLKLGGVKGKLVVDI